MNIAVGVNSVVGHNRTFVRVRPSDGGSVAPGFYFCMDWVHHE